MVEFGKKNVYAPYQLYLVMKQIFVLTPVNKLASKKNLQKWIHFIKEPFSQQNATPIS